MHRSGTSMLGHVIHDLGYSVGRSPIPGDTSNPDGYYENVEIMKLHEEILERAHSSWFDIHPIPQAFWTPELLEEFSSKLASILDQEFGEQRRRVVKDPRLCRLLPLWLHYFARTGTARVRYILPLRSPWEVAFSLKARDGFNLPMGLFLWLQHMLSAEQATRGLDRLMIAYAEMMSGQAAPALSRFLELDLEKVEASILKVVNPLLHRQRHQEVSEGKGGTLELLVLKSWTMLSAACGKHAVDQSGLDAQWRVYLDLQQLMLSLWEGRPIAIAPQRMYSSLFLDYGSGFSASNVVVTPMALSEGNFHLRFQLPRSDVPLKRLRWDPVEGEYCRVLVFGVSTPTGSLSAIPANAHRREDGADVFHTLDPIYALDGAVGDVQVVEIRGRFEVLAASRVVDWLVQDHARLQRESSSVREGKAALQIENDKLHQEGDSLCCEPVCR
ncbi:MAG: hypothetical protein RL693_1797, partial [Verrucomicrobiota bacterium]